MSSFVLQLAVGNSNDGGRGRQLLRGDRNMQEEEDLFQAAQDDEILYLVSDHLLAQLDAPPHRFYVWLHHRRLERIHRRT